MCRHVQRHDVSWQAGVAAGAFLQAHCTAAHQPAKTAPLQTAWPGERCGTRDAGQQIEAEQRTTLGGDMACAPALHSCEPEGAGRSRMPLQQAGGWRRATASSSHANQEPWQESRRGGRTCEHRTPGCGGRRCPPPASPQPPTWCTPCPGCAFNCTPIGRTGNSIIVDEQ